MVDDHLVAFLDKPCIGYLATRDANMVPHGHRPLGHLLAPDRKSIRLLFQQRLLRDVAGDVADNAAAAVSLCDPLTFETYQLKGQISAVEPATDTDRAVYAKFSEGIMAVLHQIGMPEPPFRKYLAEAPRIAVVLQIAEVFNQTPGPGAGALRQPGDGAQLPANRGGK